MPQDETSSHEDDTPSSPLEIKHVREGDAKGAFVVESGGERTAEMTYSRAGADIVIIDHTWVDDSLRGRNVGRRLLDALVAWVRQERVRVMPLCPFARSVFDKDASIRDVLLP